MTRRMKMGYVEVEMQPACNLFPAGARARGHVFHFSEIVRFDFLPRVVYMYCWAEVRQVTARAVHHQDSAHACFGQVQEQVVGGLGATSAADDQADEQPGQKWSLAYSATMQTPGVTHCLVAHISVWAMSVLYTQCANPPRGLQGPSRLRRDLSLTMCWRAMFISISRARRSRWRALSLRAAAQWTL